jgi:hypothetical protein
MGRWIVYKALYEHNREAAIKLATLMYVGDACTNFSERSTSESCSGPLSREKPLSGLIFCDEYDGRTCQSSLSFLNSAPTVKELSLLFFDDETHIDRYEEFYNKFNIQVESNVARHLNRTLVNR